METDEGKDDDRTYDASCCHLPLHKSFFKIWSIVHSGIYPIRRISRWNRNIFYQHAVKTVKDRQDSRSDALFVKQTKMQMQKVQE